MKKLKQMYRCIEELKYRNSKTTGCPTKTFGHDRRCGFTLVELVIVIAIVIILSVISVPIYRGYVDKAKWAEAYALVGTIASAQKAYYAEYGNFLRLQQTSATSSSEWYTCNETVLGIDARSNKYFTSFRAGPGMGADITKVFDCGVLIPMDLRRSPEQNSAWMGIDNNGKIYYLYFNKN